MGKPGKRRPSSITKLPPELRAELDRLLADGRLTLTDITAHLRTLGGAVSRSAVHRYSQDFEQMAADIRMTREMAQAIGRELEATEGDAGRMLIESGHALLMRVRTQITSGDLDVGDAATFARALRDLESAKKSNVDVEIKVRDRALKDGAEAASAKAKTLGYSEDHVQMIRAAVLGVGKAS